MHKILIVLLLSLILLVWVTTTTSPENVSAGLFMVVYGLLYVLIASVVALLLQVLRVSEIIHWSDRRILRIALVAAAPPVFLLLLNSVGQLTVRDLALALALFALLYAYFNRFSLKPRQQ